MHIIISEFSIEVNKKSIFNMYFIEMNGGIGKIEMLKKTNILALVGGGKSPWFPPNNLIIWDDHQGKIISKLRFNENILNIRLRNDKIISILQKKLYIFNLKTLETISIFDTFCNPSGIIGISNGDNNKLIIAFPYESQGHVYVGNIISNKMEEISKISAHESKIACLSVNKDGTILATSSDKGTIIRIFTTFGGVKFSEFRRGTKNVIMNCITFDQNNRFMGCTSNGGTLHIFSIIGIMNILNENSNVNKKGNNNLEEEPKNSKSLLGKIGGFLNIKHSYLDSERNFARFKIQEPYSLLSFGNDNTFVVLTLDGKYYKAAYDPKKGGESCKIEEKKILEDE